MDNPTATVTYLQDLRTSAVHLSSNAEIITDAPTDNFGKGAAFSPTDCCATSLAMCMLTVMGIHTNNTDYVLDGSQAIVKKVMASAPRRISEIHIVMDIKTSRVLSQDEQKTLERIAFACPVAHSLHPDIIQNVIINF